MSCDYRTLAVAGVQGLQPYQPGKPIDELARELGLDPGRIVKLASNENPLGPSPLALEAIQRALPDLCLYPDGNGFVLKQKLSARYSVKADQLLLGNGSNDVLELIVRAFADPSAEVMYSQYAFAVYPLATQAVGARHCCVPARNWGHDLDAMLAAISPATRLIFIANPNNPTGTGLSRTELTQFLDQVPEQVLVVLDEAYGEYIDDPSFPDGLSLLAQYPNLIVTRTFSKAWGLAALRVGYAVARADIIDVLNRVRQPFNVSSLALAAATAVLDDEDYILKARRLNTQGLAQFVEGFASMGLDYIPSMGNFIAVNVGRPALPVYQQLLGQGVIVRPVVNYGMPEHLRISVGYPEQNARCLEALRQVLA